MESYAPLHLKCWKSVSYRASKQKCWEAFSLFLASFWAPNCRLNAKTRLFCISLGEGRCRHIDEERDILHDAADCRVDPKSHPGTFWRSTRHRLLLGTSPTGDCSTLAYPSGRILLILCGRVGWSINLRTRKRCFVRMLMLHPPLTSQSIYCPSTIA